MVSEKRRERFHGRVAGTAAVACAHPGCAAEGAFRAPMTNRGRQTGEAWQMLCLDHVRAFNAGYNYFDGLSPDAIYRAESGRGRWERTTRPFASNAARADPAAFADPLGVMRGRFGDAAFHRMATKSGNVLNKKDIDALKVLGLNADAEASDLRRAFRDLIRRYHPDRNGGDRSHEGKLQQVIDAYTHLKKNSAFATV